MKTVILDCRRLLQKERAHLYLAEALDFPDYYGKNLDALFDCLTELGECIIGLDGENILHEADNYGIKVLKVLEEAAQVNSNLKLSRQGAEIQGMET